MSKLIKKERNIHAEFHRGPGIHSKEYAHYCGLKTWMKPRHFKKREVEYPERDMDGSPFVEPDGYNYLRERK